MLVLQNSIFQLIFLGLTSWFLSREVTNRIIKYNPKILVTEYLSLNIEKEEISILMGLVSILWVILLKFLFSLP